ncbi:MAG: EthD family reductase [Polyangiales bacterium]
MTAHLLVMYPHPNDPKKFERSYREEHLPFAGPRLTGATGVVSKRVVSTPGERPQYFAVSDISFPTLDALMACASSAGGKAALAHAASISTGGPPVVVVVTDDFASA